jgi:hypothetical protein
LSPKNQQPFPRRAPALGFFSRLSSPAARGLSASTTPPHRTGPQHHTQAKKTTRQATARALPCETAPQATRHRAPFSLSGRFFALPPAPHPTRNPRPAPTRTHREPPKRPRLAPLRTLARLRPRLALLSGALFCRFAPGATPNRKKSRPLCWQAVCDYHLSPHLRARSLSDGGAVSWRS